MRALDPEKLNYELAAAALRWVASQGAPGAVLVFMPGALASSALTMPMQGQSGMCLDVLVLELFCCCGCCTVVYAHSVCSDDVRCAWQA